MFFTNTSRKLLHLHHASHCQRRSLVNTLRMNIQNTLRAISRHATGLLDNEGDWVGFIQQSQFAFRILFRWWIEKHTAFKKGTVEVRHHRADVARGIGLVQLTLTQVLQELAIPLWEAIPVGFVYRVIVSLPGHFDV